MPRQKILLIMHDQETSGLLERAVASIPGSALLIVDEWNFAQEILEQEDLDLVLISDTMPGPPGLNPALRLIEKSPLTPVVLIMGVLASDQKVIEAMRQGFFDCLRPPLLLDQLIELLDRARQRRSQLSRIVRQAAGQGNKELEKRIDSLEMMAKMGRQVTSMLELDRVLAAVVDAAVELTEAEEGSLLLLDENTGELYMRASKNFQEEFARTFRLPIRNSLVSEVLRSGAPLVIDEDTPQKIKTSYLVHTLVYIPLIVQERVIGVLEVDHRQTRKSFNRDQISLLSVMADYAAVAIENARVYHRSEYERVKLESILQGIDEGVVVMDTDHRLVLINGKARQAFDITDPSVAGKRLRDVIHHQELLETLRDADRESPSRVELTLKDGRVLNTQLTPLKDIGLVVSMQDITHLKELDRIKSDFVNTVSHDLRSPLTAILGYIELVERVGSLNNQQREFINRVQVSVHNITALINDLLDLGRIEAGFDVRKEVVPLSAIVQYAVDGLRPRSEEKKQTLALDIASDLPPVLGNPIRLRQMMNNLLINAVKYTTEGGSVSVAAHAQSGQVILQVTDNGPGIPPTDQPYIFDKFYRASNVPHDSPGTGLGLAIVKSIVENHLGRIWVDSQLGQGTTFTIILPITERGL